jgi:hypothetical protein
MTVFLNIFLHIMLVGSLLLFVVYGLLVTFRTNSLIERLIRLAAWFSGAMVVIGARTGGLSFADFTVDALSGTRPASAAAKLIGAIVPATLGIALASYLTNSLRKSNNVAIRVIAFVGMLAATQFAEIYAAAMSTHGVNIGAAAIPNIAFVVGIVMYIVLKYDPEDRTKRFSWQVSGGFRLKRPTRAADNGVAGDPSDESMFKRPANR